MPKLLRTEPQLVMKNGKANAVIIAIKDYRQLLERLEDKEDLADLDRIRNGSLHFRKFDDFLKEHDNAL